MEKITITRKILKIGDSLGILIGCSERTLLDVNAGDIIEVTIKKIKEEKIISLKCRACEHVFDIEENSEQEYECPACENKKFYKVSK